VDPIWAEAVNQHRFYARPLRHHRFGPSHFEYSGLQINATNFGGIYSWHTGANILFCDGHVQFFAEDTDPEVLLKLISRAGGEP
jgi:prepilin-type processing-associated H-X9-DG protein